MNKLVLTWTLTLATQLATAANLTREQAIQRAEQYVIENGYTNAPRSQIKQDPDRESLVFTTEIKKELAMRFNTLRPKAIGATLEKGRHRPQEWAVAFDYVSPRFSEVCRIVVMNPDGSEPYMEHVDGNRRYFKGK